MHSKTKNITQKQFKFISRALLFAVSVGLLIGCFYSRTIQSIAKVITPASFQIQQAAASELYTTHLPLIVQPPAPPSIFGASLEFTNPKAINAMTAAGNHWLRHSTIAWSEVEPTPGTRDWSSQSLIETELINAQQQGMEMIVIVNGTPDWAQKYPGVLCGPIKEDDITAFASFMYDLVTRYSQSPYNVTYWEIWNEPDIDHTLVAPDSGFGCWGDKNDPYYGGGYYGEVLKAVYPEIKRANPQAQVLVGGLLLDCDPRITGLCSGQDGNLPPKFLEGILRRNGANDGGNYFDGISFHAYDFYNSYGRYDNPNWNSSSDITGPVVIPKAEFIKEELNNFGVTGKYLMNTESAVICGGPQDPPGGPGCEINPDSPYEQTKAFYVAQVYVSAMTVDLRANIWYHVFGWRNSNLLNFPSSPRPAYEAFAASRDILQDATFSKEIYDFPGVRIYEFTRGQHRIWVLWSLDGNTHQILLESKSSTIFGVLGNSITPANPIQVGPAPLYLEWDP